MSTRKKKIKKTPQFTIFDRKSPYHIDALQVALLRAGKHTILPELYDIFGKEKLLEFLDIFSGATFVVPDRSVIENAIRDTYIYLDMDRARKKGGEKAMSAVVKELASRYDIDEIHVWRIYKDMRKYF